MLVIHTYVLYIFAVTDTLPLPDCRIQLIGKPVLQRNPVGGGDPGHGSFMMDTFQYENDEQDPDGNRDKIWETKSEFRW